MLTFITVFVVAWLLPETERTERHDAAAFGVGVAWKIVRRPGIRDALLAYLAVVIGWNIFFQFASVLLLVRFDSTSAQLGAVRGAGRRLRSHRVVGCRALAQSALRSIASRSGARDDDSCGHYLRVRG